MRLLDEIRNRSFENHSQFTVLTGRRRIGKTKLMTKSCQGTPTVYLFVSRNNETTLCTKFSSVIRESIGAYVPDGISSFVQLFELLINFGVNHKFNLLIDEFQEFKRVNESIFSGIQDVWDRYKDRTNVNLIVSGSVYALMHEIFMENDGPLYGRVDSIFRLRPFKTDVIREILNDHYPQYTNDDLLALYTITGGVPKYIEVLMDRNAFTVRDMIEQVTVENSIFLEEGNILLIQEFGKKYGNYFSILSAIASGRNTVSAISEAIGDSNIGGLLSRLEEDYEIIRKKRPILSKQRSQNVVYEISDNFLRFWFRYIEPNQNLIQMEMNRQLGEIILSDYNTYSGYTLEGWFRTKLGESGEYREISSWWERKKGIEANEIDIVAIKMNKSSALVAEVKRQRRNYDHKAFMEKVERIKNAVLGSFNIETKLFTLDDM